jgi:hypothetical protein
MLTMLAAHGTGKDVVIGWRYLLDADKAGTTDLSVGMRITDTGEELTCTCATRSSASPMA